MANQQSGGGVTLPDMYRVVYSNGLRVDHSGTLSETVIKTYTLLAGALGISGALRLRVSGQVFLPTAAADIRIKFGGTEIAKITRPLGGSMRDFTFIVTCHNQGAENSQIWTIIELALLAIEDIECNKTSAINTAANAVIDITGDLGEVNDHIYIGDVTIEMRPTP